MEEKRLYKLIQKYAAGTATPEEEQELHQWYREGDIGPVDWPVALPEEPKTKGQTSSDGEPKADFPNPNPPDHTSAPSGLSEEAGHLSMDGQSRLFEAKEELRLRMLRRLQDQMRSPVQIHASLEAKASMELNEQEESAGYLAYAAGQTRNQEPATGAGGIRRILHFKGWRVAASLILVVTVAWIAYRYQRLSSARNTQYVIVHNPSGKIQEIQLPDSTKVWLNAESTLRYAKAFGSQRELFLEGEAYFDVVRDPGNPFIVHSGSLTTTVLGTVFDVKSFAGEQQASVSVIRGKVQVQDSAGVLDILTPSRQLQWDMKTGKTRTVTVDTGQVVGWQQGRLKFQGQSLEEITASLGRWYNVQFKFSNPGMRSCRYYLNFENTITLENLLTTIGEMNDMTFRIDDDRKTVTLNGKECP